VNPAWSKDSSGLLEGVLETRDVFEHIGRNNQVERFIFVRQRRYILADSTIRPRTTPLLFGLIKTPHMFASTRQHFAERRVRIQLKDFHLVQLTAISISQLFRQKLITLVCGTKDTGTELGRDSVANENG
jgi:hypothetical protein